MVWNWRGMLGLTSRKQNLEERVDGQPTEAIPELQTDRVKLTQTADDGLFKKIKLEESFQTLDYSAQAIWRYFLTNGSISKVAGKTTYGSKDATPILRSSEKGPYPVEAVFEATVENSKYVVHFDNNSDKLKCTIECDVRDLNSVYDIFSLGKLQIVSVEKRYDNNLPLRNLYSMLRSNPSLQILSSRYNSTPRIVLDPEFGLLPVEARLNARIDGVDYSFFIGESFMSGAKITAECPPDKVDYVSALLDRLAERETPVGGGDAAATNHSRSKFAISTAGYDWSKVGGMDVYRSELEQKLVYPMLNPMLYKEMKTPIPKGVILIGPPGTGKTTMLMVVANIIGAVLYKITPSDYESMWNGVSENTLTDIFHDAIDENNIGKSEETPLGTPVMILFDEIDGIFSSDAMQEHSQKMYTQFKQELDNVSKINGIVCVAATNMYDRIPSALKRRYPVAIYIGNPDEEGRKQIIGIHANLDHLAPDVDLGYLAAQTDGFAGAELEIVCHAATYSAIDSFSKKSGIPVKDINGDMIKEIRITKYDFDQAIINRREYMASHQPLD